MSPLEVLQLVGYSIGAGLPLWMGIQLFSRRRKLNSIERLLFALALTMFGWHLSNLLVTLHGLFGFRYDNWSPVLRTVDTLSVVSITFAYSFLLHIHLLLWATVASERRLTLFEKLRLALSYGPVLFLPIAIYKIWDGPYAPMYSAVNFLVLPMAVWITYVLVVIAATELLIARKSTNRSEQRIMRTLAVSFLGIGAVILAALAFGLGEGTQLGLYLHTLANLGSLLPSALLAYYIYRYRYLELIIEESLIVATFAAVILAVYLYGIRTAGDWVTSRYGVRAGVVEALLILVLALAAAPLRRWLETRFHKLFEREATLYRQIVSRISTQAGQYRELPELLDFVEQQTTAALGLRKVRIAVTPEAESTGGLENGRETGPSEAWITRLLELSGKQRWMPVEDDSGLEANGYTIAFPLRRDEEVFGLMLVDAASGSMNQDARAVLQILADQVAIAIDDSRLVEENVRLERKLAERERLATLGQMAATVAHEIKNPLSAIKSIAQVMGEDKNLNEDYARDLSLIVGETDRLGQSVNQLLTFARREAPRELPMRANQLVEAVVRLFEANAQKEGVNLNVDVRSEEELNGAAVSAVRVALSNLLINALQATPSGGTISITEQIEDGHLVITVEDGGAGIPSELRQRIWEPFFTTKQRGTGLGLAIVRKRMQEAEGTARLAASTNGKGARFELWVPLAD
ncbi:MAG TPA: ATP-binding protein [Pyrinomonadaceae bacterium]|nr:ATP-binding protein [Pyrinomonadaceae bacterium]